MGRQWYYTTAGAPFFVRLMESGIVCGQLDDPIGNEFEPVDTLDDDAESRYRFLDETFRGGQFVGGDVSGAMGRWYEMQDESITSLIFSIY